MSVGLLIGKTWSLALAHAGRIAAAMCMVLLPGELLFAYAAENGDTSGRVAFAALALVAYPWAFGVAIAALDRPAGGIVGAVGRSTTSLPALFLANLAGGVALILALLALILPGLLLAARWSATGALIVSARRAAFDAFADSNALVKGRTWMVLGALLVTGVIAFVLAVPGLIAAEIVSSPWASALANVAADVPLFGTFALFSYAVFTVLPDAAADRD